MKKLVSLVIVLFAASASAQVSNRGVIVKDEGSQLGFARSVNFVGSSVSCGISGGQATCTFSAPSVTITAGSTDWSGCTGNGAIFYAGYSVPGKVLCNKATINDSTGAITLASTTVPLVMAASSFFQMASSFLGASNQLFTGGASTDLGLRGDANLWLGVGNNPMLKFNSGGIAAMNFDRTLTAAATTGAQTINKPQGSVNMAAAATTLVVTNSLATTTSLIFLTPQTADGTCIAFAAVRAAGSFTITANAACTAETAIAFKVTN